MARFWIVVGIIVVVALGLAAATDYDGHGRSVSKVAGMPTVQVGDHEGPAWLTIGAGVGVLVLGAGLGVIVVGIAGAGVLFATGQIAAGGICFAQLGAGVSFLCGQGGLATTAFGQVVGGVVSAGQGSLGFDGAEHLRELNRDLNRTLRFL